MRPISTLTLSAAAAVVLWASPASAQNFKSFVSITGDDGNTCATDAAPCRTLTGAHGKTSAGGIIYCLDSGDFTSGTLTITKSIVIDCTGGLLRVGGIAVAIAAAATDVIHIRGLTISTTDTAIRLTSPGGVGSLRIEDCDFVSSGNVPVVLLGGVISNANVFEALFVNTTVSGGASGFQIKPDGGGAKVTLDRLRVFNSGVGVDVIGTNATTEPNLKVAIKDSTISGNTNHGVRATSTNGLTRVLVQNSLVAENGAGLRAVGAKAVVEALGSTISYNGIGLSPVNGAVLSSFGNNAVVGNSANGAFTTTAALK